MRIKIRKRNKILFIRSYNGDPDTTNFRYQVFTKKLNADFKNISLFSSINLKKTQNTLFRYFYMRGKIFELHFNIRTKRLHVWGMKNANKNDSALFEKIFEKYICY